MPVDHLEENFIKRSPVSTTFRVFLDFDNTITQCDVIDEIIKTFSIDNDWIDLEEGWHNNQISAKECLVGQLLKVRVTKKDLDKFLAKVRLDEGFYTLLSFLKLNNLEPVILSDNFTTIIGQILNNHGVAGIKVYANDLYFYKDRLFPSFPYNNPDCPSCAHCKKIHFMQDKIENKSIVYIGDGRSDFCPTLVSDIVFAKDTLAGYLTQAGREFISYKNLGEVAQWFKKYENSNFICDRFYCSQVLS